MQLWEGSVALVGVARRQFGGFYEGKGHNPAYHMKGCLSQVAVRGSGAGQG